MVTHQDRLVVLGFMNPGNMSLITSQPHGTSTPYSDYDRDLDDVVSATSSLTTDETTPEDSMVDNHQPTKLTTVLLPAQTSSGTAQLDTSKSTGVLTTTARVAAGSAATNLQQEATSKLPARGNLASLKIISNGSNQSKRKLLRERMKANKKSSSGGGNSRGVIYIGGNNSYSRPMALTMNNLEDLDHPDKLDVEVEQSKNYILFFL